MFNKQDMDKIIEKYTFDSGKYLLYIYWNDPSEEDSLGAIEESKTELIAHSGILEMKEYFYDKDSKKYTAEVDNHYFIPYEQIHSLKILPDF